MHINNGGFKTLNTLKFHQLRDKCTENDVWSPTFKLNYLSSLIVPYKIYIINVLFKI